MKQQDGGNHPVVSAPAQSRFLRSLPWVSLHSDGETSPSITYPRGFVAAGVAAGIKNSGKPDVGVVAVTPECRDQAVSAALFTTNAFAAAPVVLNRQECDLQHLVALAMNSGNANACTGEAGLASARRMREACARALAVSEERVAVGSTGIIGVPLPIDIVSEGVSAAAAKAATEGGTAFARSIMTTDRFPKTCAFDVSLPSGLVRLGVCAKGAGMIAPAMATMLCVVTTDALLEPGLARQMLREAVDNTFNRITVDGEMSTNDSVFFLASGASGVKLVGEDVSLFAQALEGALLRIALMMVADGEGATKVMRLVVTGAESPDQAERVARAVAQSPLVKAAMHGGNPNWGRIASAAGAAMAGYALPNACVVLGGVTVMETGTARLLSPEERAAVTAAVRQPEVDIAVDLGLGEASAEIYFADLGHEYITINAEYHT
ncbi:MAG: bifunctional glutamate N-acetyltransferase/amino-acid acetyltransferase ArgJ [Thermoleophilia bacterium]|nr:bifunctional glutamate N-acetyltransferase/amino-acid acetyltransferase ArgJ [Thermoleophilia bacterium]